VSGRRHPAVAFLAAELARVEETARAASGHNWLTTPGDKPGDSWVIDETMHLLEAETATAGHIALHDPASVLRRVAADRALLADLQGERHLVVDGDCWYTCTAATEDGDGGENCDDERRGNPCDCGRDTRVERRVLLLAEAWGWTEEDTK
jgi:hypothetical protein